MCVFVNMIGMNVFMYVVTSVRMCVCRLLVVLLGDYYYPVAYGLPATVP